MARTTESEGAVTLQQSGESEAGADERSAFAFEEESGEGQGRRPSKRVMSRLGRQSNWLLDQANGRARQFADSGKERVDAKLEAVIELVEDGARTIEERFGADLGGPVRQAADQVVGFASSLRDKSVDDLIEDSRTIVRKQPLVAFGIAAIAGLALARVIQAGIDEAANERRSEGDEA